MDIKIKCAYDSLRGLKDLSRNPGNPRRFERERLDALKKAIVRLGLFKPFVVTAEGTILCGNMRHKALEELVSEGYSVDCPVSIFEGTDVELKQVLVLDNEEFGEWVPEELSVVLQDIAVDVPDFEIDNDVEFTVDDSLVDEEEPPVVSVEGGITKPGDLWELGNHRLLCGDATLISDVTRLMGTELNGEQYKHETE
jgi:hypothetical protein